MSIKQRFYLFMTIAWAVLLLVLFVRMIVTADYRLWAVALALLCVVAVFLRGYALEWRRLKDEREAEITKNQKF